jgi:hypothetical protein
MKPAHDFIDTIYKFKGKWDLPSLCGLKIVKKNDKHIVIATDLHDDNPGTAVAEFCAELANIICMEFSIKHYSLIFIEHTPEMKSKLSHNSETFDIVTFEWDGEKFINPPDWKRITREEFLKMIE